VPFEQVERFVLAVVDVRRRTSARHHRYIGHEEGAARLLACEDKRHQLSGAPVGRTDSSGHVPDLVLPRRGFSSICAPGDGLLHGLM
jgi:hypothetical protein